MTQPTIKRGIYFHSELLVVWSPCQSRTLSTPGNDSSGSIGRRSGRWTDICEPTFGHSLDDYDVLHQISLHGGPIRMGDLAEQLLVANSSCNRIVGRLVDGGFVERSHGEADRREVLVDLTPAGKRLRRRMAAVHTRDIEAHFGARLTANEIAAVDAALRRLLAVRPR